MKDESEKNRDWISNLSTKKKKRMIKMKKGKITEEKEIFNKEKNLLDSDESFEKPFQQNQTEKEENERKWPK